MRIIIDYDGSIVKCKVTEAIALASNPDIESNKYYDFNELDYINKATAMAAIETIRKRYLNDCKSKGISVTIV